MPKAGSSIKHSAETLGDEVFFRRGDSWYKWKANMLNSLFESRGRKGAAPANITWETVRHGEQTQGKMEPAG